MILLVLILRIDESVRKNSRVLVMKFINDSINRPGTGRISSCLNRLLHKVLGGAGSHNYDDMLV
jgi:hypothetical protein